MVKPIFINKRKEKEKEVEKENEKSKELLAKKRVEPDTPNKEVDMIKIKKKIKEMMFSIYKDSNNSLNNEDIFYQTMSKNYLLNEFSSNCLNYINKIITNILKNQLKKFQGIFELNKLFISIIKELLINEFELILLSLYLESVNISSCPDVNSFKESLIFLCLFIKKLTLSEDKLSPINSFLNRKYQGFSGKFHKWIELNKSVLDKKLYFSYIEINQRFKEFNNSYSIYCKNNYIDYNLVIDRILTMSIPYNESKTENNKINIKSNSIKEMGIELSNNDNDISKKNNININHNNSANNTQNNVNKNNSYNFNTYFSNFIPQFPAPLYPSTPLILALNNFKDGNIPQLKSNIDLCQSNKNIMPINGNNDNNIKNNIINNPCNIPNNPIKNIKSQIDNANLQSNNNADANTNSNESQNNKATLEKNENKFINKNNVSLNLSEEYKQKNSGYGNNNYNLLFSCNNFGDYFTQTYSSVFNDINQLRYNNYNLGINDLNAVSQSSLFNSKSHYFNDMNNLQNNSFHMNEREDNLKIMNPTKYNYLKSGLSINGISSSKNFYPNMPNNIQENANNNEFNNNQTINKNVLGSSIFQNNNLINKMNINTSQEKNNENINDASKSK